MHTIRTRWLTWMIGSYFVLAVAGDSAGAQAQGQGVAAVARALANYGQGLVSGAIQDWICEGTLTLFSLSGPKATLPMTLLRKGGGQVQRIVDQGGIVQRQGSDGNLTWDSIDGFRTVAQVRTQNFLEGQTNRSIHALLNHQGIGLILQDLGINGQLLSIEAADARGRKTKYTIDLNAAVISVLEFTTPAVTSPQQTPAVTDRYVFSDYRRIQGILTPFKTVRFVDGMKLEEMQFT